MKIRTSALIAMFACAIGATAEPAVLTLDDCLRIGLSENPTVKVADMEVTRTDYSKKEAIGRLLPNIDFAASYSRSLEKQVMYMNMDFDLGALGGLGGSNTELPDGTGAEETLSRAASSKSSGKDDGIKVGLDNSFSLGFQASLPLVAPQLWKSIQISNQQIYLNREKAQQSRQNLVNQIKSAYYAHMLAIDNRAVMQESYDMAELTYNTYVKLHAAGAASDYDVLRTSVALKNVEPQILQADIAIKQTRLQLLILMGVDSDFEFTIADRLSNYESTMYEQTIAALSHDYSGNADLKIMDINREMLNKTVTLQKFAYIPTLAFVANYNWTSMSDGSPFKNFRWNPYSSVGLSLSVPVFSGGQRYHAVKQAEVQAAELNLQRLNLDRSVAMQVDLAIDNMKINVQQISSCSESMRQAEQAHTIMEKSFAIGAASYLDLRDSELALTRARLAYYQAIYNYLCAGNDLELLQGSADIDKFTSAK